jgi:hypothetical protein
MAENASDLICGMKNTLKGKPNQKRCGNDCGNLTTNRLLTSIKPIDLAERVSALIAFHAGSTKVIYLDFTNEDRRIVVST